MGSPTSPSIAKIVVQFFETKWKELENFENITFLVRYMDDYLGKWSGSVNTLEEFVKDINLLDPHIKLTLEIEKEGSLNYLDSTITRENNNLTFKTFEKEFSSKAVLPGDAFQDKSVKRSLIIGETIRTLRISDDTENDLNKLKRKLMNNNYSKPFIENTMNQAVKLETKRSQTTDQSSKAQKKPKLITKFLGRASDKLRKKLRPLNIQVVNKKQLNLEGIFSSSFKYKTDNESGIVYKIYCNCGDYYIGESGFDFQKRKNEHIRDLRTSTGTNALVNHCTESDHFIDWSKSSLLDRESDRTRRKLKESLLIKDQKPRINISEGMKIRGDWIIR